MKVPWTEDKTSEEILQMVETEREIMDTVRSRQKRWLGHILKHDSLLRITLEGQIQGKKVHGRPRKMFLDWLLKTEEGNISYEELKMSAQDRAFTRVVLEKAHKMVIVVGFKYVNLNHIFYAYFWRVLWHVEKLIY